MTTGIWENDPADAADQDADGTVDAIDNCTSVSNFDQSITAFDPDNFAWAVEAPVVWVRGDLASVVTYATNHVETQLPSIRLTDVTVPVPGTAFYYLVRPDCPTGSCHNSDGTEPGRDAALP